ncbi:MAG: KpsF/GutQ family sugar-phosphate isomerase [Calditrichaeota bacterium]|nr:KpsF/GutQ family sugar-phosphate isomerase [Calditrichota bacterium]MCB9367884.1 KpsF/GutQ family sugar-phosphate isomerase [Calditrichota bacterium]
MSPKENIPDSLAAAKRLLEIESAAVQTLAGRVDGEFRRAIELLLGIRGHVVVTGVGKSGHVGRKISATLASTGTPSSFLHPAEAAHGDLGMVTRDDAAIVISKSGASDELWTVLPYLKVLGIPIIGLLGDPKSSLAERCDVVLDVSVAEEGCPMNLAPTASTTAALAMGDALAVALLTAKGFQADDFKFLHPGGALGRRLSLTVQNIMHTGANMPIVAADDDLKSSIMVMTRMRLGAVCIQNDKGELEGIFTDGDLRRALERNVDLSSVKIGEVSTKNPRSIQQDALVSRAVNIMEQFNIMVLPVVNRQNHLVGIVHMHDLLKSGIGK